MIPVGKETADRFVKILKEKISKLKVGPYTDDEVDFGPVISKESKETVIEYINRSLEEGAKLIRTEGIQKFKIIKRLLFRSNITR